MSVENDGARPLGIGAIGVVVALVALPFILPSVTLASEVLVFAVATLD